MFLSQISAVLNEGSPAVPPTNLLPLLKEALQEHKAQLSQWAVPIKKTEVTISPYIDCYLMIIIIIILF